jgi:hypothetical protein
MAGKMAGKMVGRMLANLLSSGLFSWRSASLVAAVLIVWAGVYVKVTLTLVLKPSE